MAALVLFAFTACNNTKDPQTTTSAGGASTTTLGDVTTVAPSTDGDPTTSEIPLPTISKLDAPTSVDASKLLSEDYDPNQEYKNPVLNSENTGDPFVMRYNGKYYLYFTSRGVKCFVSDNLVTWKSCGTVAEIDGIPYAPEVYYYNGYFYMYTSPDGGGHYVLRSDSPTGPFKPITENLGMSIDGSVFIDDDGQWYFYRADSTGIIVYKMSSPSDIVGNGSNAVSSMNGWTEGPSVIKYNGVYYMTYCGNHYLAPGYRINYATSTDSPMKFAVASNGNPLLVETFTAAKGLGHNSMVIGPDLDSYYMVYHAMPKTDGTRDTRIDRVYFSGSEMIVMAPTVNAQDLLKLPQVYSYFNSGDDLSAWKLSNATLGDGYITIGSGGMILTNDSFADKYTAELNVLSIGSGMAGAIFGYTDENNFGVALFDPASQELVVRFTVGGNTTEQRFPLTKSFGEDMSFDCLQKLTVVRNGKTYTFSVNNIVLGSVESELSDGSFGAVAEGGEARFGFAAINPYADQSSTKEFYKPTDSYFNAETCIEEDLTFDEKYSAKAIVAKADSYFNYRVNTMLSGSYDAAIKYYSDTEARVDLYQNGNYLGSVMLPATDGEIATAVLSNFELKVCYGIVTLRVSSGQTNLLGIKLDRLKDDPLNISTNKGYSSLKPLYKDGNWKLEQDSISLISGDSTGKLLFGNYHWNNYSYEATVKFTTTKVNGGLLVRASNPSLGGANDSVSGGYVFYQGYYLVIARNSLRLVKINYGTKDVAKVACDIKPKTAYDFRIDVVGAEILVYLDGELVIDYTDPEPFIQGAVGLSGSETKMQVTDIKVTGIK